MPPLFIHCDRFTRQLIWLVYECSEKFYHAHGEYTVGSPHLRPAASESHRRKDDPVGSV